MIYPDNLTNITGTLVWYYFVCKREVWFIAHNIIAQQDNPLMELGRVIHKYSYKNDKKEILIDNTIKIDIIKNNNIIAEIKKSSKYILPAKMQLLYYLYYLKKIKKIEKRGYLFFPEERKKIEIVLDEDSINEIEKVIIEITKIINLPKPPPPKKNIFCKNCAYEEICWA